MANTIDNPRWSRRQPEQEPRLEPQQPTLPSEALIDAITSLLAVCRSRPDCPDSGMERLLERLATFPASVAIESLRRWPETPYGAFAPTEHDLIELCKNIVNEERSKFAARGFNDEARSGRYTLPTGLTTSAARRIKAIDSKFFAAWFKPKVNIQYTNDTIYTTGIGFCRIAAKFENILDDEGVTLVGCPKVSFMLAKFDSLTRDCPIPTLDDFAATQPQVRSPRQPESADERKAVIKALCDSGLARRRGMHHVLS